MVLPALSKYPDGTGLVGSLAEFEKLIADETEKQAR